MEAGIRGNAPEEAHQGGSHGANRQTLVGVPHFREVDFYGRFPTADLVFRDERFPGGVRLTALSPFIPHNDHGIPRAGNQFGEVWRVGQK